jgi:hypothetical protein
MRECYIYEISECLIDKKTAEKLCTYKRITANKYFVYCTDINTDKRCDLIIN